MKTLQAVRVFTVLMLVSLVISACGSNPGNSSKSANGSKEQTNASETNKSNNQNKATETKDNKPEPKKPITLLNVSYDPTRELYKEFNEAFAAHWKQETGQEVTIEQSHGGSGKQGRAVIEGLEADVVTLALGYDIEEISQAGLIDENWQQKFEHNSSPYTSTIVFLVRKGNPKGIKDWDDLVKPGIEVITPNPKTSGGARWNYLAAYAFALDKYNKDEEKAKQYLKDLYKNVPVLDTGARGSTTTFVERKIGDVLLAWENEAILSIKELGPDEFDIIAPPTSILTEPPVAIVDKNADKKGTREVAEAYLKYLYTEEGQVIAAKNYYRPRLESVAEQFKDQFPVISKFVTIDDFGGWVKAQKEHFADGGIFDQIYTPGS